MHDNIPEVLPPAQFLAHNQYTMASKVVLITGANRGIGLSIAKALGQRAPQSTILVAGRSKQSAEKGVEELWQKVEGVNFRPVALDVTDDESINAAVELVGNEYGRLDGEIPFDGVLRSS